MRIIMTERLEAFPEAETETDKISPERAEQILLFEVHFPQKIYVAGYTPLSREGEKNVELGKGIYVTDIDTFFKLEEKLERELGEKIRSAGGKEKLSPTFAWIEKNHQDRWTNATQYDFLHPEAFLAEQLHLSESAIGEAYKDWVTTPEQRNGNEEKMWTKETISPKDMEAPHEIHTAITKEGKPNDTHELAVVRYRIKDTNTVTICSVQMPRINGSTEQSIRNKKEKTKIENEAFFTFFKNMHALNPEKYTQFFGEPIDEAEKTKDPSEYLYTYGNKVLKHIFSKRGREEDTPEEDFVLEAKHNFEHEMGLEIEDFLGDEQPQFETRGIKELFLHLLELRKQRGLPELEKKFEERRERLKLLNNPLRGNTPPALYASFANALTLFHEKGYTTIRVNTWYPTRGHNILMQGKESIEEVIQGQMIKLGERITKDIPGTTIQKDEEKKNGFYTITLPQGNLEAKNPFLRKMLSGRVSHSSQQT